jgi:hypothetical protein
MRLILPVLVLAAAASVSAQSPAPSPSTDVRAVLALDSLWARNYATHDTVTASRLMSDEFFMTSANGAVKRKAAEMNDIRPSPGLRMEYFRTEGVNAHVYGSAAVVSGFAVWAFEMNGRASAARRKYTAVYLRGGPLGWQLVELHMAAAPPAPAPGPPVRLPKLPE